MSGPTGSIYKHRFEELIVFDRVMRYVITDDRYSFNRYNFWPKTQTTMFYHYFKDGVEVGYWCCYTNDGFIFETPRVWSQEFLEHPDFILEEQRIS